MERGERKRGRERKREREKEIPKLVRQGNKKWMYLWKRLNLFDYLFDVPRIPEVHFATFSGTVY